jgi:isopentenyl-diphosphate Delta-isomerase
MPAAPIPAGKSRPLQAAQRRLFQELGLGDVPLVHLGVQEYRADVGGGLTEHEVVDLFLARLPTSITVPFNSAEVMAVDWVALDALPQRMAATPGQYTPWLQIYLAQGWAERLQAA